MQAAKCETPLWEKDILRKTAGTTLRPGGFSLTDRSISMARIPAKGRILDAGCGLGATVEHLIREHDLIAYGVDNSAQQLAQAPKGLPLVNADADNLPYPDSYFDALICECVLSLMPDMEGCITEFKRVLKPSGKLIITDLYQRNSHPTPTISGSCANSPLNLSKVEECIKKNNAHIVTLEDHSKLLAELAAKLIFAGEPSISFTGNCCSRPGYMLLIAEMK